ncbi:M48 family metalloprotease [Thiosulfativibrio zosterae]|uniref:Peptidase M48 domain-containing protein n=1 Tax=Thiosulfativibrio zosterae TaxID=2675053 RepID=A0A6F8PK58_9GAMM|nr:M48 family metalloprotease [Thiosulfativibrio zosterae]BBP42458.1 hypothetical protein THMIRHAT_02040 [Thiosulfativibrio zosterae]
MILRLLVLGLLSSLSLQVQALQNTRMSVLEAADEWTPQDLEAEIYFGRNLAAKMLGQSPLYADEVAQGYVNELGASLAKNSNRPDLKFYFAILDDEQINAFAAPGGYVFITKGAIEFCENEAELAGILAHEIGHVTERHIVKQLKIRGKNADQMTGLMSSMIMGGGQTLTSAFSMAMDEALDTWKGAGLKDRKDEYQADQISTEILLKTGYDPKALAGYLARVSEHKEEVKDRVRTHPPFHLRIKAIEQQLYGTKPLDQFENPQRLNNNLASIFKYVEEETLAKNLFLYAPPLESESFQSYLNQMNGAVNAVQGKKNVLPVFAVLSDEVFYKRYDYFTVISSGLLSQLENEAQLASLLTVFSIPEGQKNIDDAISMAMINLGYNPMAWVEVLSHFEAQIQDFEFQNAKVRSQQLRKDLSDDGALNQKRWQEQFKFALAETVEKGILPLAYMAQIDASEKRNRYLNLVAYSIAKAIGYENFNGLLVIQSDLPMMRLQVNQVLLSSSVLNELNNEAELAGLIANTMLYGLNRRQNLQKHSDEIYLEADSSTMSLLNELGYGPAHWLAYLKARETKGSSEFKNLINQSNIDDRTAILTQKTQGRPAWKRFGQSHEQRFKEYMKS